MLAFITAFFLFSAFLLLLLVSLSVPIIKTIFLFRLLAKVSTSILDTRVSGGANFGVWGYCTSNINLSIVGLTINGQTGQCTSPHLGFTLDKNLATALGVNNSLQNVITRGSTALFVLHPIACGLTFLTLVLSILFHARYRGGPRLVSVIAVVVGFLSAFITTIIFLADVIIVAVIRHRVHNETDGLLTLNWGNAVWMVLGATVALWASLVGTCAGICACGSRRRKTATY